MRTKNRYLFFALACFLGLVAVFVVDGYMGVYDTISVKSGETKQVFQADFWSQPFAQASVGASTREVITFTYQVDNRWPSNYQSTFHARLEQNQQLVSLLATENISLGAFQKSEWAFTLDTATLPNLSTGSQYTLVIERGALLRTVIIYLNSPGLPLLVKG